MTLGNPPSKQRLRISPAKKLQVKLNPKIGTSNLYKKKSVECSVSNYNKYEFGVKSTRLSSNNLQIYNAKQIVHSELESERGPFVMKEHLMKMHKI